MSTKGAASGSWSADALARSYERDAELREQRPERPSSSVVPARCATCGHWNAVENWHCSDCGVPFIARPIWGAPSVTRLDRG